MGAAVFAMVGGVVLVAGLIALCIIMSKGGSGGGGGDGGKPRIEYKTSGEVPPDWTRVSMTITGEVLETLDCNTTSLDDAKKRCHANKYCTHVDAWPKENKYYLKDANTPPQECLAGTHKCSDGDWKDGNGGGRFHPDRGWGDKAKQIESLIKEFECSSGSACVKKKIMKIVDIVSWVIMAVSLVPISSIGSIAGTMAARVAFGAVDVVDIAMDIGQVS
jgi:hypothetical protein